MNADPEHSYPWDHLMTLGSLRSDVDLPLGILLIIMALGSLRSHVDLPLGILLIIMDADNSRQKILLKPQEIPHFTGTIEN